MWVQVWWGWMGAVIALRAGHCLLFRPPQVILDKLFSLFECLRVCSHNRMPEPGLLLKNRNLFLLVQGAEFRVKAAAVSCVIRAMTPPCPLPSRDISVSPQAGEGRARE